MIGAIIGDVVGSRFEHHNIKSKDFTLLTARCVPTDDSAMSLAVAQALLNCDGDMEILSDLTVRWMQKIGRKYPHAGYGGRFRRWLYADDPRPYYSYGNGAAMRVSACGFAADSLEQAKAYARAVTEVTHDHPESIKAAEAISSAIYMAMHGSDMHAIREHIEGNYYDIDFTLDEIRDSYTFDVSCQGSVPQAFAAFFESVDFEDAIRNAISIGGDSDTIAAITGGIAEAYYGVPESLRKEVEDHLDDFQTDIITKFESRFPPKITDL